MTTRMLFLASFLSLVPLAARAHCDTLDGPVVQTARASLDSGDVAPVLAWVKPAGEREIRAAFRKAVEARQKSPATRDASDRRFLETVVRVHRAGEGAPYTGLKPAGDGVPEAVRAADAAIASRDASHVEEMLADAARDGVRRRFQTLSARQPPGSDVAAGREWVEAYVDYVHYVERVDTTARGAGAHHGEEAAHQGAPAHPSAAAHGAAHH